MWRGADQQEEEEEEEECLIAEQHAIPPGFPSLFSRLFLSVSGTSTSRRAFPQPFPTVLLFSLPFQLPRAIRGAFEIHERAEDERRE